MVLLGGGIFVLTSIARSGGADLGSAACNDLTVHINQQGALAGISPQGKLVQITITSEKETKVLTMDRCTGTLLQTLTVAP